ncbi:hypothetical protein KM043_009880 [Ampulex compressa]|nr:hypothetical protein KM043_009880 [Ampulex compressa]
MQLPIANTQSRGKGVLREKEEEEEEEAAEEEAVERNEKGVEEERKKGAFLRLRFTSPLRIGPSRPRCPWPAPRAEGRGPDEEDEEPERGTDRSGPREEPAAAMVTVAFPPRLVAMETPRGPISLRLSRPSSQPPPGRVPFALKGTRSLERANAPTFSPPAGIRSYSLRPSLVDAPSGGGKRLETACGRACAIFLSSTASHGVSTESFDRLSSGRDLRACLSSPGGGFI